MTPASPARWSFRLLCAASALPCLIVLGSFAVSGAAALWTGRGLIWTPREETLSEAVALRDRGEVLWQLMTGADPNGTYEVVNVLRVETRVRLSPLEAAILSREVDLVDTLVDWGALIDQRNRATLVCLAIAVNAQQELVGRLVDRAGQPPSCDGVALPWQP